MADAANEDRFDSFGLESPFASGGGTAYESEPWSGEEPAGESLSPQAWVTQINTQVANAGRTAPRADDPPQLADLLKIPGRFDDPKRDAAMEYDGTRFGAFLLTRDRRQFAAEWLNSHPALAAAAKAPNELTAGDIAKGWFVIHDIGAGGSVKDGNLYNPASKHWPRWKKKKAVHGYLNWSGSYAAIQDFDKTANGTVFEFLSPKGKVCYGRTINIETVPDIEKFNLNPDGSRPPPSHPERYGSIGFGKLGRKAAAETNRTHAYYKWTNASFDALADLYILTSARAGHLLTVTAHKEVDRNLAKSRLWRDYSAEDFRNPKGWKAPYLLKARDHPSDYHGDPYAFDMQAFYDVVTRKLNALGGLQIPAGARYGIHPARLRKPTGQDIVNGDSQLHEFPHQSDPVVKTDGNIKKNGWWKAAGEGETREEAPWSQGEWMASLAEADGFEAADQEDNEMYGMHEFEDGELDGSEGLDWLDTQSETALCPRCGGQEAWPGEAWSEDEDAYEHEFEYEGGGAAAAERPGGNGSALILQEAFGEFETSQDSTPYALLKAIPDNPDYARFVPIDYRLDAKAMVGKLSVDLKQLKTPDAKEMAKFAKDVFKIVGGGDPGSVMINILVGVLKNIPGGYLAAAGEIAKDWSARGFARGVVLGANGRSKKLLIEMFGHEYIPPNNFFPYGRKVAAANYGGGLLTGYVQGRALSKNQGAIFWRDLGRRMGDQSFRGPSAGWSDKVWQEWYVEAAAIYRRYHLTA